MKTHGFYLCQLLSILLSFTFSSGYTQNVRIRFTVKDFLTQFDIVDYKITITDFLQNSGQRIYNSNEGYLDLLPQSTLDVSFSSQDYLDKVIRFDLRDLPKDDVGGFEMDIEVNLMSGKIGFDNQIFKVPSCVVYYNKDIDTLIMDCENLRKHQLLVDNELERINGGIQKLDGTDLRLYPNGKKISWQSGFTSTYPWITSEFRFYDLNMTDPSFQVLCPFINWAEDGAASLTSIPSTFNYLDNSIQEWSRIKLPERIYLLENGIYREDSLIHLLNECINQGMMTFDSDDFSNPDIKVVGYLANSATSKRFFWKDKHDHRVKKQVKCIGFSIDRLNSGLITYVDVNETLRDYTKNWYVSLGETKKNFLESIEEGDFTSEILNVKPIDFESNFLGVQSKLFGDESDRREYLKTKFISDLQYEFESQQDISHLINTIDSATYVPEIIDSSKFITDFLLPNYFGSFLKEQVKRSCDNNLVKRRNCDFNADGFSFRSKLVRGDKSQQWEVKRNNIKLFEFNLNDNQNLQGPFAIYHSNGNLSFQGEFQENELHSKLIEYYENGRIKANYNFANGYLEGKQVEYFETGKIRAEYSMNGCQGELDGAFTDYYTDGSVKSKGNFTNNLKEGKWYYKIMPSAFWLGLIRSIPKFESENLTNPTSYRLLKTHDFVEIEAFHKITMEDLPKGISTIETVNFINACK
jgi:hypothetical protein